MARTMVHRGTRLVTLALATGTLVATAATGAGAAPAAAKTEQFTAAANGSALDLVLNLPVALPGIGSTIHQQISFTDGKVSLLSAPDALATSVLGDGSIPVASAVLAKTVKSTLASPSGSDQILDQTVGPIAIKLGKITSKVATPSSSATGTLSQGASQLAGLTIAGNLPTSSITSLVAPVTQTLNDALGTASGTVASTVNSTISQLNQASQGAAAPVATAVTQSVNNLTSTLNGLTTTLNNLDAATSLVDLSALTSSHVISKAGSAVTSHSESGVAAVNVLGGLVKVEGLTSAATATAGGVAGSAKTSVVKPVLHLSVANGALDFVIGENGAQLSALSQTLPPDLQKAVNDALGSVNGLLNEVAGVKVDYGKAVTSAAPDGTAAAASVSAATLTVNPPVLGMPATKPFLQIRFVPADANVAAKLISAAPAVPPTKDKTLAFTGAEFPVTAGLGGLLLAAAAVASRRRRSVND